MRAKESKKFFASVDGNYDRPKLQTKLKHLGLEYQDFTVGLDETPEKFLLIWNTAYTWEQFQQIILSLNKAIKNGTVWLGRKVDENYQIDVWKIDSKGNSKRQETKTIDAATITIDASNMKFGEFQDNICAASSECMTGCYARRRLLDELEVPAYNSDYEKFMAIKDRLSITTIRRYFQLSYPKAKSIIDDMVECGAIEKDTYKLLSIKKYKEFISKFEGEKNNGI